MSLLDKIFGKNAEKDLALTRDQIAAMLKTNPEALAQFEAAYRTQVLGTEDHEDTIHTPAPIAKEMNRDVPYGAEITEQVIKDAAAIQDRIVNELLAQTMVFSFDGDLSHPTTQAPAIRALPAGTEPVTCEEANRIPRTLRPQCTANACAKQINGNTAASLLMLYQDFLDESKTPEQRKFAYNHFRQGLDILDLDPITYEILGLNKNSISHWLPQLIEACRGQEYFKIPATRIAKVPMPLLQMTRLDYEELTPTTKHIIDLWAQKAFQLDPEKDYFVKTGTYSSKFDFRNAHVHGAQEVMELGEYLAYIQYQASIMAGPLCSPCIYGMSTTNEWVVREFIQDKENNPTIYKGLPLHTEYRVFVDCDKDIILGFTPYWEPETMKQRFGHEPDADSPHQMHDYIIYQAHEDTLMDRFYANIDMVLQNVEKLLPKLDLHGQWSIDIMQNGEDFWIIDMALAEKSVFYQTCVPEAFRKPTPENWLPDFSTLSLPVQSDNNAKSES